jgi:hypothetical protein
MEKETLQEAAERIFNIPDDKKGDVYFGSNIAHLRKGFNFGAKWQSEKMYSDMEEYSAFVLKSYKEGLPLLLAKEWFEQFKKK